MLVSRGRRLIAEDFDGDYQGDEAFELKGSEDLAMDRGADV